MQKGSSDRNKRKYFQNNWFTLCQFASFYFHQFRSIRIHFLFYKINLEVIRRKLESSHFEPELIKLYSRYNVIKQILKLCSLNFRRMLFDLEGRISNIAWILFNSEYFKRKIGNRAKIIGKKIRYFQIQTRSLLSMIKLSLSIYVQKFVCACF